VVTRSGGNSYHGSIFEFIRNDKLDARSFFSPVRGKLRFNISVDSTARSKKDKLFFFAGQEWKYIRLDSGAVRPFKCQPERRGGDFSVRLRGPDASVGTRR